MTYWQNMSQDIMLSSLVELLEEKGVLIQEEWERRIKERAFIK